MLSGVLNMKSSDSYRYFPPYFTTNFTFVYAGTFSVTSPDAPVTPSAHLVPASSTTLTVELTGALSSWRWTLTVTSTSLLSSISAFVVLSFSTFALVVFGKSPVGYAAVMFTSPTGTFSTVAQPSSPTLPVFSQVPVVLLLEILKYA